MRDNFNKSVKETLAKRVGFLCSNPKCRSLTIGPNSNEDKTTNIGVAAHITGASINGPRYDGNLTSKQRSSIKNAIWLCQSCAKLIDSDENKYTKELLNHWKVLAEEETELQLNKTFQDQPTNDYNEIIDYMPELINEIIEDIQNNPVAREFILQKKGWVYNSDRQILVYYYDDHENLDQKILILENNELIRNITYNNTKRYVFEEKFIQILKKLKTAGNKG